MHGGLATTLRLPRSAAAVHFTLAKGEAYTTLEIKVNLVRALTTDTGRVTRKPASCIAHARSERPKPICATRRPLYANATSSCTIFPAKIRDLALQSLSSRDGLQESCRARASQREPAATTS